MKIKDLINVLSEIRDEHGNVECDLQIGPSDRVDIITGFPQFFVVAEEYENGIVANIRIWPY